MSNQSPIPYFPSPPKEYSQQYLSQLVRSFAVFAQQQTNAGQGRHTTMVLTELPTSPAGLEPGTVYVDGDTLKVVPTPP